MRDRWATPGLLLLLLLAACGSADGGRGPAPVPRSIDPSTGFTGQPTAVRIDGDNFLVRPVGGQVDDRHRAWLDDLELGDVTWIDAHTLGATVPAEITPGSKALTVENAFGRRGTLAGAYTAVELPAALAAAASVDGSPGVVGVGQALTLLLVASNPGGAPAEVTSLAVTPVEAGCGAPTPPTPQAVAGGRSITFAFTCAPATPGSFAPVLEVGGRDARSGGPLGAAATLAPALTVQAPAALTAAVGAVPTSLGLGQATEVTFYVTNGAGAPTATVDAVTPWLAGSGGATCSAVPHAGNVSIAAGATWSAGWTCSATGVGELLLGGTLSYSAGGRHLAASPAAPLAVTVE